MTDGPHYGLTLKMSGHVKAAPEGALTLQDLADFHKLLHSGVASGVRWGAPPLHPPGQVDRHTAPSAYPKTRGSPWVLGYCGLPPFSGVSPADAFHRCLLPLCRCVCRDLCRVWVVLIMPSTKAAIRVAIRVSRRWGERIVVSADHSFGCASPSSPCRILGLTFALCPRRLPT